MDIWKTKRKGYIAVLMTDIKMLFLEVFILVLNFNVTSLRIFWNSVLPRTYGFYQWRIPKFGIKAKR